MKLLSIAAAGLMLGAFAIAPASASAVACGTYNSSNGGNDFQHATDVGTVGMDTDQICQIGFIDPQGKIDDQASFTESNYPSIYSFSYGGGELTVSESAYNGGGDATNIEVVLYSLTTGKTVQVATVTYSLDTGFNPAATLFALDLDEGIYAIENTFPQLLNPINCPDDSCSDPADQDPKYQVNFVSAAKVSDPTPPVSVPEPWTLALFGAGLAGAAMARRRRNTNPA